MRCPIRTALVSLLCAGAHVAAQPIIVTAAGTDLVFQGSGHSATSVSVGRVSRVALDPSGRIVFADPNFHLVMRVEADGSITVIAGNNVQGLTGTSVKGGLSGSGGGYSGDGGPAIYAALNRPQAVAYDQSGNLYIADTANHRIRMVDTHGVISTIAGTGVAGYQGDGGNPLNALLSFPTDIVVDRTGNIYFNDSGSFHIRKITAQNVISTVAGNGKDSPLAGESVAAASSAIGDVEGMAVDSQGSLYFSEFSNNRVRRLTGTLLTTVAGNPSGNGGFNGDGPAATAQLSGPSGLAFDSNSNLLISDTSNERIRRLNAGSLTTIVGSGQVGASDGPALSATLHYPWGVAVSPTGDVYIADRDNFRIRHLDASNRVSTLAGDGRLISAQNGVPALQATFLDPFGVSFDLRGALIVSDTDNNIVRRLNSDGTLSQLAGTGAQASSSAAGPALQAELSGPFSVTADLLGSLLESEFNASKVRKIDTGNQIRDIFDLPDSGNPTQAVTDSAGTLYVADFAGPVYKMSSSGVLSQISGFQHPGGVALDSTSNIYVTDWGTGLVWRISPSGTATLLAGGGTLAGIAADGGVATKALLGRPSGIVVDSTFNVYFSDSSKETVRKVTPDGTISTVAGNGTATFSGDGGLATSASLRGPWGLALDPSGALYAADVGNNRIRKILLNSSPTFGVDTQTLSFSGKSNGVITDFKFVTPSSSLPGLLYGVATDQPWLTATPGIAAVPSPVQVTADPTGLTAGPHTGHVIISAPGANPSSVSVAVTFTVSSADAPALGVDTTTIGLSFIAGATPTTRALTIRNTGGGSLSYSVTIPSSCGPWLSAAPLVGTAVPNAPASLTLTVSPGQLQSGLYQCTVSVASPSASSPTQVAVVVAVSAATAKLQLSQSGLTFQMVAGGGLPVPRGFAIANTGQGSMTWNARTTALSGGQWLSVSPATGTLTTDVGQVSVSLNPSSLPSNSGTYYGKVDVSIAGSLMVQTVSVVLKILPAGTSAQPDIYPAGLVFTGAQGSNPSSQSFSIADITAMPVSFTSSRLTPGEDAWFVHVATSGTIASSQPSNIVVQPDYTNLTPGTHRGSIVFQFSDGSTESVTVTAVVVPPPTQGGIMARSENGPAAGGCSSVTVTPVQPASTTFSAALQQSVPLEVKVVDGCGSPVTSGSVFAIFTNGDKQADLKHFGGGTWSGTWAPQNAAAQVTVHVIAIVTIGQQGEVDLTCTLGSALPTPSPQAVVNAASYQSTFVAPGGLVSIFGTQLANQTSVGSGPPFSTDVAGTQVLVGGQPLPLRYVSANQINAQVPFGLDVDTQLDLVVQRGATLSQSAKLVVAASQPAIYTQDQSGTGPGAITDAVTFVLNTTATPAKAGDTIAVFGNGLGAVNAPDAFGLLWTSNPVTATIGGKAAQVTFSGLAPGYPDLYQVNVAVPSGVGSGNQDVILSVAGQNSPSGVTVALK